MNTPRFNKQLVWLPDAMLPNHVKAVYKEILRDAGLSLLYNDNPINCIQESLVGINNPGLNIKLMNQKFQSPNKQGSISKYFPNSANGALTVPDDSLTLTFRHIDGFHNYMMLFLSASYSHSHLLQSKKGEKFVIAGNVISRIELTDNYSLLRTYKDLVYESIDPLNTKFNQGVQESTFNVRFKFMFFMADLYYKDTKILTTVNDLTANPRQHGNEIELIQ